MVLPPSPFRSRWIQLLVLLIGLHSCLLGSLMLFLPRPMLLFLGFEPATPIFFPSQSGIFLLILGCCYLLALKKAAMVWVILISKALAVVFLVVHAAFLEAPGMVWAAAAGDATMLAFLGLALRYWKEPVLSRLVSRGRQSRQAPGPWEVAHHEED